MFLEKEIRHAEADIADLIDRYNVASKEELYERIGSKKIQSHPAWEDYIIWKNKEKYITGHQPQSPQRAQSINAFLCVLCALCGFSIQKIIQSL